MQKLTILCKLKNYLLYVKLNIICHKLYNLLKSDLKYLLMLLKEYFFYKKICEENGILWPNYEVQIWQKLLIINGFREPLPKLSRIIRFESKIKKIRKKNSKFHTQLPNQSKLITKLFRDTKELRYQKQLQLTEILERFERKVVYRFYPRISKRYQNIKKRRMAR